MEDQPFDGFEVYANYCNSIIEKILQIANN